MEESIVYESWWGLGDRDAELLSTIKTEMLLGCPEAELLGALADFKFKSLDGCRFQCLEECVAVSGSFEDFNFQFR